MRRRMGAVDTAWLRMGEPGDPVDVGALLQFDGGFGPDELTRLVQERLLDRWDRFGERIVQPLGTVRPRWTTDRGFSLGHHLRHIAAPGGGDEASLQQLVGELMSDPFDPKHPPWRFTLIEGVDGGSALFARIHHCVGDGFALAHALLSIADGIPPSPEAPSPAALGPVRATALGARLGAELAHVLALPFDTTTTLRGRTSGIRHAAWSAGFDVAGLKQAAHRRGVTLNDLLMTALAGAFRQVLAARDELSDAMTLRACVPVNLRPVRSIEEMPDALGNRFGLVFLPLPVQVADREERLARLHAAMEDLKRRPQALVALGMLNALGRLPTALARVADQVLARKASAVVSNVPGPRRRLRFLGHELRRLVFWVPHPARLSIGASLLSYAGELRAGVRADASVLDDPSRLVGGFEDELAALV